MNTQMRANRDACLVGVLLEWEPLSKVGRHEMGALISELREDKEWDLERCKSAFRAYRTHRLVMRKIMGLKIVREVAA